MVRVDVMQVDTLQVNAVLVPVHVLGRDLRFGPILRVPVQAEDRDPHLPRNALVKNAKNIGNRLAEASLIPYICYV